MARARNIKPGFFKNDQLVELAFEYRLLFAGLWTLADREGYLEDRPKRIKMEVFPGDNVDIERGLEALAGCGLIQRYMVGESRYIHICKFLEHQNPHHKEAPSTIPKPEASPGRDQGKPGARPGPAPTKASDDPADSGFLIPDSLKTPMSGKPDPEAPSPSAQQAVEVIEHLNVRAGKRFRPVEANVGLVRARLREGATVEDCKAVIDRKVAKWGGDPKMAEYLRPATLFGKEKFAQYLGEVGASPPGQGMDWWSEKGYGSRESAIADGCAEPA